MFFFIVIFIPQYLGLEALTIFAPLRFPKVNYILN